MGNGKLVASYTNDSRRGLDAVVLQNGAFVDVYIERDVVSLYDEAVPAASRWRQPTSVRANEHGRVWVRETMCDFGDGVFCAVDSQFVYVAV